MRVLVFGATGMLGHKLVQVLSPEFETFGTVRGGIIGLADLPCFRSARLIGGVDATDSALVEDLIKSLKPAVVVNAVGLVKQHSLGGDESACTLINEIVPRDIASVCEAAGARFIGISTDCVFTGNSGNYNEESEPDAVDVYGQSKLRGEVSVGSALTIRTSIIGRELSGSHGLLEWFLANRGGSVKGYANAIFSGFPTVVLADVLKKVIIEQSALRGLFHVSSDPISKFELLELINLAFGAGILIESECETRIDRSLDSTRFREATGFRPAPWAEMVERMANDAEWYEAWRK